MPWNKRVSNQSLAFINDNKESQGAIPGRSKDSRPESVTGSVISTWIEAALSIYFLQLTWRLVLGFVTSQMAQNASVLRVKEVRRQAGQPMKPS
jgi:hypothetical protein